MKNIIGKWGAYSIESNCCWGFGKIVMVSPEGSVTIEVGSSGGSSVSVPRRKVAVFKTPEEASARFHEDDERRQEIMSANNF